MWCLACPEGFEPPTPSLGNSYSIQLNYGHIPIDSKPTKPVETIDMFGENGNVGNFGINGAPRPTRTDHLLITNQLLYQMS